MTIRTERDSMGEMEVPSDILHGASTQRAVLNFPISGRPVPAAVIQAFAHLKEACAAVNAELGRLEPPVAKAIAEAAQTIRDGLNGDGGALVSGSEGRQAMDHFPVDVFQTGSGTSTNMNVNEVLSNLACLAAAQPIGAKNPVHPNDHANMGQSSNDTFPTAMQVAGAEAITRSLVPALTRLRDALREKADAFSEIVKLGRTHLMDATPITLGQEFSGYADQIDKAIGRAESAASALASNLPIGGTAVGTGINTHPEFGAKVAQRLTEALGISFAEADNHFEAQATRDCVVEASGFLRTVAVSFTKIANDLRWMGSGPRGGLFEIALPAVQPGSSIMPGKVNPVICESAMMVACRVQGNDLAVALGGTGGVGSLLELNVAMPMMADAFLDSVGLLSATADMLVDRCLNSLEPNLSEIERHLERSLMTCTALAPVIGYDEAADIAKVAFKNGSTVREETLRRGLVAPEELDRLLDPGSMTRPA
jgi:fumarate hydratase class II